MKEDRESWKNFFVWLKERGLKGIRLIIGDKYLGMLESIPEVFPDVRYQRCTVHLYRNVFTVTPRTKMRTVSIMVKAIHSQESKAAAREKAALVAEKLQELKLTAAAKKIESEATIPRNESIGKSSAVQRRLELFQMARAL